MFGIKRMIAAAVLASVLTGSIAWKLHDFSVARLKEKHRQALDLQKADLQLECAAEKAITTEVSREYQKKLADLGKRAAAKRLRPQACVPVIAAGPAGGHHATPGPDALRPAAGVDPAALDALAADAEADRLKLLGCQQFIRDTWKLKAGP